MDHRLLEIIACPVCHGKLSYNKDNLELICKFDHLAYPIRDGIPVLLEVEARQVSLDEGTVTIMFTVIIPARYASTRLPGKPLADIHGKPMVVRVMEQAIKSGASRVIVATDHPDVAAAVIQAGGEACMTNPDHQSGTERLAEVIDTYGFLDDEIIVNVQGDEPLIPPEIISQVAGNIQGSKANMGTLAVPIHDAAEAFNPNAVKVVTDNEGYALYFSRATIPWDRDNFAVSQDKISDCFLRHIGIYAYRAGFIRRYIKWEASPLEKIEMLEQLRVLWYGEKIHVAVAEKTPGAGVDTPQDLELVRKQFIL